MKFSRPDADIYVPDGTSPSDALAGVTHLGIGAHQDDLEFMALEGIGLCLNSDESRFGGVVCTDGAGSARVGEFADHGDDEMRAVRRLEQRRAAEIGHYSIMIQLDYPSASIRASGFSALVSDLSAILALCHPRIVYSHNPADKHESHVRVFAATIAALRTIPEDQQPEWVIGCEVWRGLDWLNDDEKVVMDLSRYGQLSEDLNRQFASQIAGGKRYDLAIPARRRANATFFQSHSTDQCDEVAFAMDLTPLLDPETDIETFVLGAVDRFRADVRDRLSRALRSNG